MDEPSEACVFRSRSFRRPPESSVGRARAHMRHWWNICQFEIKESRWHGVAPSISVWICELGVAERSRSCQSSIRANTACTNYTVVWWLMNKAAAAQSQTEPSDSFLHVLYYSSDDSCKRFVIIETKCTEVLVIVSQKIWAITESLRFLRPQTLVELQKEAWCCFREAIFNAAKWTNSSTTWCNYVGLSVAVCCISVVV